MKNLKSFGANGYAQRNNIDLAYLVGWLETLVEDEENNCENAKRHGPKAARLTKASWALQLLQEISENEP